MKILIINGHPNIKESKVNKRFLEESLQNSDISIRNLSELYPNFQINKEKEQEELMNADRVIFQFPFYWYSAPAILKKWLDDVFEYNFAFGPEGDKLKGKELLLSITIGGPETSYIGGGYNNYSINEFLKPFQQVASLSQMEYRSPFYLHDAVRIAQSNDYDLLTKLAQNYYLHITNELLDPIKRREALNKKIAEKGGIK